MSKLQLQIWISHKFCHTHCTRLTWLIGLSESCILYMIKTNVVFLLVVGAQSFKMFGAKLCLYKSILSFPFALWLLPSIFSISKKTFMAALFLVIELLITRQGKSSWIFFFFLSLSVWNLMLLATSFTVQLASFNVSN